MPDLASWRRARMPELPDVAFFELAPDWACEMLSPSTAADVLRSSLRLEMRSITREPSRSVCGS